MANELKHIQKMIYEIRGQKVMLDRDLAELYGIEVKRLNEAVKRNIERFPSDFMFQLTEDEWDNLRSQFATAKDNHGGRRRLLYAFTFLNQNSSKTSFAIYIWNIFFILNIFIPFFQ